MGDRVGANYYLGKEARNTRVTGKGRQEGVFFFVRDINKVDKVKVLLNANAYPNLPATITQSACCLGSYSKSI